MTREELETIYVENYDYFIKTFSRLGCSDTTIAEDALNNTMWKIMRRGIEHINIVHAKTYIVRSMLNYNKSEAKLKARLLNLTDPYLNQLEDTDSESPFDLIEAEDRFEIIVGLIERLKPAQKEVAIGICKGIRMSQLAKDIGKPHDTVRANWRFVASKIKQELNNKGEDFLWRVNI